MGILGIVKGKLVKNDVSLIRLLSLIIVIIIITYCNGFAYITFLVFFFSENDQNRQGNVHRLCTEKQVLMA